MQPLHLPVTPLAIRLNLKPQRDAQPSAATQPAAAASFAQHLAPAPGPTLLQACQHKVVQDVQKESNLGVKRYESVDAVTGRKWGQPSAYGRGQCLNCPDKAAPPSMLCERCQQQAYGSSPMPQERLQYVKAALEEAAALRTSGNAVAARRARSDLDVLSQRLDSATISELVQNELVLISDALKAGDCEQAKRRYGELVKDQCHWTQHKELLQALRRVIQ